MIYKRESRKREIAQSAIDALRLYGYARTTLRDIAAVQGLSTRKDIRTAFCHAMAETIAGEAELHRLWYDIRNQAMFDKTFVPVVGSIEDQLIEIMSPLADTRAQKELLYLRLDGAFRYLLQLQLTDNPRSLAEMTTVFETIAE